MHHNVCSCFLCREGGIVFYFRHVFCAVLVFATVMYCTTGCATMAEEIEFLVPSHVDSAETRAFELEGLQCEAIELNVCFVDGSCSHLIWAVGETHEECEAEMERLAR